MKKIIINSENRRFNISSMVIGYLEENKAEKIEFEIPKEYQNYGKKACFSANGTTFAKLFDNITSNILTITRDISQFNELDLSIEFFKTENEDEIIARTSILHIVIENAVVCEDVKPDDEKVVILNELIEKVTNLESESTKNEELRQENEQNRIKNEEERVQYFDDIKEKVENGDFNGKDAMINGVNTLEIVEGENISLQQQANVLTISNTYQYDDSEIKGNIEEIKQNLINYSLVTETGSKVVLNINPSTYVMTLELKDKNNNTISSGQVDLPLETMVVNATYKDETKEIELTLQNGTKVSFSVADLVSGLVNENDLTTKLNDYALKTSIPTKTSQLTNDSGFINKSVNNLDNYYKKTEIDTKVQTINKTTNELGTRLTTAEKNIETNKTDIKDLSNRTKRIETDIFDSGEASGTGINLQDSTLAEFQEVKIDGVGNQVTTNGNQILDLANPSFKSVGVTSTFENDILTIVENAGSTYQSVTWKLSKTFLEKNKGKTIKYKHKSAKISNQEASSNVQISVGYTDDTPIFYRKIYDFNTQGTDTYVIPSDISNISYIHVGIYTNNSANTDVENTITIEEPLLYFDDNDTYEPYTGAEPSPSPDYKQPIEVIEDNFDLVSCGTNLVNWSDVKPGSFGSIGKYENNTLTVTSEKPQTYPAVFYDISDILKRYANKKLKFICEDSYVSNEEARANVQMTVITNDGKTQYIPLYNIQTKNNTPTTILPNIKSAIVGVYANNSSTAVANTSTIVKPMLFISDGEDENIEPYTETRQTITMPEGEFAGKIDDTYKDQFRINYNEEDGKYHLYLDKNIGKDVFDGDETWTRTQGVTYFRYKSKLSKKPKMTGYNRGICLSNYFIYHNDYPTDKIGTIFVSTDNNCYIYPKEQDSTEQFKQWLSTHNTEVYYVLAEPYTLDLGVVNMPLSYYPITNVYNTCVGIPNMYVKYYRDFKKTITTMQVDIQELKSTIQELTSNQTELLSQINALQENQVVEEESEVVTQ